MSVIHSAVQTPIFHDPTEIGFVKIEQLHIARIYLESAEFLRLCVLEVRIERGRSPYADLCLSDQAEEMDGKDDWKSLRHPQLLALHFVWVLKVYVRAFCMLLTYLVFHPFPFDKRII